ncbi:hypothetical protein NCC78_01885 [Micromonospora phytophila]|uniref:hypothetical protein n=1 Tax=Micromonospora phytophila TaxID=709888 RepID=UPI002030668C|nr:hypothetical protein [Micromonospora phytophila]MCM0673477.1 hypothetical protein [Micromonospora phytophila]
MGAHILNACNLPIYDVRVVFSLMRLDPMVDSFVAESIRVVPPHQDELLIEVPQALASKVSSEVLRGGIDVSLEFRDAAGRRWVRGGGVFCST